MSEPMPFQLIAGNRADPVQGSQDTFHNVVDSTLAVLMCLGSAWPYAQLYSITPVYLPDLMTCLPFKPCLSLVCFH